MQPMNGKATCENKLQFLKNENIFNTRRAAKLIPQYFIQWTQKKAFQNKRGLINLQHNQRTEHLPRFVSWGKGGDKINNCKFDNNESSEDFVQQRSFL